MWVNYKKSLFQRNKKVIFFGLKNYMSSIPVFAPHCIIFKYQVCYLFFPKYANFVLPCSRKYLLDSFAMLKKILGLLYLLCERKYLLVIFAMQQITFARHSCYAANYLLTIFLSAAEKLWSFWRANEQGYGNENGWYGVTNISEKDSE